MKTSISRFLNNKLVYLSLCICNLTNRYLLKSMFPIVAISGAGSMAKKSVQIEISIGITGSGSGSTHWFI